MFSLRGIPARRGLLRAVTLIIVLLAAYWVLVRPTPPYPGNKAPNMTIYSLMKGIPYQLQALRGHWIMLNFWASWCPPCRDEFPNLVRLYKKLAHDDRWTFIWVSVSEPESDARSFIRDLSKQMDLDADSLPVFIDTTGQARTKYGVWKYPETFIIDPTGTIVERIIGPQPWIESTWLNRFSNLSF